MPAGNHETAHDGFSENAYRYYLTSVDGSGASYVDGDTIRPGHQKHAPRWSDTSVDERNPVADEAAPPAKLNGD